MRARVKHTLFIGEVVGSSGTAQSPTIELLMKDGSIVCYRQQQLTDKPPLDYIFNLLERIKIYLTP